MQSGKKVTCSSGTPWALCFCPCGLAERPLCRPEPFPAARVALMLLLLSVGESKTRPAATMQLTSHRGRIPCCGWDHPWVPPPCFGVPPANGASPCSRPHLPAPRASGLLRGGSKPPPSRCPLPPRLTGGLIAAAAAPGSAPLPRRPRAPGPAAAAPLGLAASRHPARHRQQLGAAGARRPGQPGTPGCKGREEPPRPGPQR